MNKPVLNSWYGCPQAINKACSTFCMVTLSPAVRMSSNTTQTSCRCDNFLVVSRSHWDHLTVVGDCCNVSSIPWNWSCASLFNSSTSNWRSWQIILETDTYQPLLCRYCLEAEVTGPLISSLLIFKSRNLYKHGDKKFCKWIPYMQPLHILHKYPLDPWDPLIRQPNALLK